MSKLPTIEDYVDLDKLPVDREEYDRLTAELAQARAEHQHTIELLKVRNVEAETLRAALKSITDRVIPGTVDSVDALTAIVAERDALGARCAAYEKALEDIANHKMTSVDKVYLIQQCEGFQARAARALAPSGGGGE